MPTYKLTITKSPDTPEPQRNQASNAIQAPIEIIYSHDLPDEAAAKKLIHDITKPVRVYRPRAGKTAKAAQ